MKHLRLSILGFGVVGQGLAELLETKHNMLCQRYDVDVSLVSVANSRSGFIYCEDGLQIPLLLELARTRQPLTAHPQIRHWADPLVGLRETRGDMLAEATGTNLRDAEPGISYIRAALQQGMHVITANKGPLALAGQELLALAHEHQVQLRFESTVMAGTPVISTAVEGLAGATITSIRGILNGTTNYILSAMAQGRDYAEVLADAQAQGYAEADPTADVEGYDAVAKVLILAAQLFGQTLKPDQVQRQGISSVTQADVQRAHSEGKRIKLIASLLQTAETGQLVQASVAPLALPLSDPLSQIDGVINAITLHTDTLGDVTISGSGAGRLQTGQGLLADLLAIAQTF
ncbi:MAG TPA: homoserine dehydrogenase [Dictyobacter sp.]|jgi:homoserine dehydrogenase|nr:homoserine dehydrogenase [Dictyobacter sp.]